LLGAGPNLELHLFGPVVVRIVRIDELAVENKQLPRLYIAIVSAPLKGVEIDVRRPKGSERTSR